MGTLGRTAPLVLSLALVPRLLFSGSVEDRLDRCFTALGEILHVPESLPKELLDKAECVLVIPSVKKVAVGFGASFGRGALLCRTGDDFTGPWGPPAMYRLEGGNIGFQLGGSATDFLLLVMNPHGAESLFKSKVKLGADAAAVAGPKGREALAATDGLMHAEILSYSRSRGLFAGVALEGSTLRQDGRANEELYKSQIPAREIVAGSKVPVPPAGQRLVSLLQEVSPRNESDH